MLATTMASSSSQHPNTAWNPYAFEPDDVLHWRFGTLDIWAQRTGLEWWIGWTFDKEKKSGWAIADALPHPKDLVWNRWPCGPKEDSLRFEPALPDRPLILRPTDAIFVPPGERMTSFIAVPLWIRIKKTVKGAPQLIELPTQHLSNTWFGNWTEGELCYSLKCKVERRFDDLDKRRKDLVICPLEVRNKTDDTLQLERVCVRVPHLALYQGPTYRWTAAGRIVYRGAHQPSRVVFGNSAPTFQDDCRSLATARLTNRRGLLARSFGHQSMPDMEGL